MKKQFFIYITLLFHILLIKEIKSYEEEILNKFGSIKTKYISMILNTSEFERGVDIYITLESELNCDNYIRYQFYDDINEIYNQTSDLKFNLRAESSSVTNILGKKTHLSFYYTINKNRESLDNSNGNMALPTSVLNRPPWIDWVDFFSDEAEVLFSGIDIGLT